MGPWNVIFFLVYEKLQNSYPYVGRWDYVTHVYCIPQYSCIFRLQIYPKCKGGLTLNAIYSKEQNIPYHSGQPCKTNYCFQLHKYVTVFSHLRTWLLPIGFSLVIYIASDAIYQSYSCCDQPFWNCDWLWHLIFEILLWSTRYVIITFLMYTYCRVHHPRITRQFLALCC